MEHDFSEQLARLGFALTPGNTAPSEQLVRAYERRFGLTLPADYRSFLIRHGGVWGGTAVCAMLEPTPFGVDACIDGFYGFQDDELADMTEVIKGAPEIVALGSEPLGRMFWLVCAEPDAGAVYIHDHYHRSAWSDEEFLRWPDLAPEIRRYLELRRAGELPEKPEGFEDVYLVARSFTDFIDRLRPYQSAAEPAPPDE